MGMAKISPNYLQPLTPLRELTDDALESLSQAVEIEDVPARTIIFQAGKSDDLTRYLLAGELILVQPSGEKETIVAMGNDGIANRPFGLGKPHELTAVARTNCKMIQIPTDHLNRLLESSRLPQYQVDDSADSGGAEGEAVYFELIQALLEDKLELPPMPDIAIKVRNAIADDKTGASDVAKILQVDPVVAARIIQAANSALFAGKAQVDNLSAAIVRVGLKNTRELVMAMTVRDVFKAKTPLLNKRMVELWMHTTMVASIASVLAKRIRGFQSDRALLAGLTHDIGAVPMLVHANQYESLAKDPSLLEDALEQYGPEIGGMILRRWNFPDELVEVPLEANNWTREHDGPGDVADLIVVAQLLSFSSTPLADRYPNLSECPAYHKFDFGETDEDATQLLEEAREEIAEVQKLLIS